MGSAITFPTPKFILSSVDKRYTSLRFIPGFTESYRLFMNDTVKTVTVPSISKEHIVNTLNQHSNMCNEDIEEAWNSVQNFNEDGIYKGLFFFNPGSVNVLENRIDAGYGLLFIKAENHPSDSAYNINIRVDEDVKF